MNISRKYRTKAVEVEAVQWFKHGDHPKVHHTAYDAIPAIGKAAQCVPADHPYGYLDTPRGRECVGKGDWIVTDAKGVWRYPPGEFEEKFESESYSTPDEFQAGHVVTLRTRPLMEYQDYTLEQQSPYAMNRLNEMAADGWRVIHSQDKRGDSSTRILLLDREKPEEEPESFTSPDRGYAVCCFASDEPTYHNRDTGEFQRELTVPCVYYSADAPRLLRDQKGSTYRVVYLKKVDGVWVDTEVKP